MMTVDGQETNKFGQTSGDMEVCSYQFIIQYRVELNKGDFSVSVFSLGETET